ncbi:MAG: hypothetical protein ACYDHT_07040 [Solirubrobacteraceae bacterium]
MSDDDAHHENTDPTAQPRPSIELSKTASGKYVWKIRAYAMDDTPAALSAARDIAVTINGELAERYPG